MALSRQLKMTQDAMCVRYSNTKSQVAFVTYKSSQFSPCIKLNLVEVATKQYLSFLDFLEACFNI